MWHAFPVMSALFGSECGPAVSRRQLALVQKYAARCASVRIVGLEKSSHGIPQSLVLDE